MRTITVLLFSCTIFLAPSFAQDKPASSQSGKAEAGSAGVFSQDVTPATKGNGEIAIISHSPPLTHSCSASCEGVSIGSWTCSDPGADPGYCALDCTTSPPRTYCEKR